MSEYQSSEELQRHNATGVFANKAAEKKPVDITEQEKLRRLLDKHIKQHSSTVDVRDLAKKNTRTADYQLDLSADLVKILEKIKSELR